MFVAICTAAPIDFYDRFVHRDCQDRVGQSQPRAGGERRHYDPQQPFTLRWLPCGVQRPLDQIASMPATGQLETFAGYAKIPGKQSPAGGRWVLAQSRRISKRQLNIDVGHGVIATRREYEVGQVALSGDGNATPPTCRGGSFLTSDQVTSDEGSKDR